MNRADIDSLIELPLKELILSADNLRRGNTGNSLDLCNIMNAKSGLCSQDCKFCAQSLHHATGIANYPLKDKADIANSARHAKEMGAGRFGIVTSGAGLSKKEIAKVSEAISEIKKTIDIKICASLGKIDEEDLLLLKKSGLSRYHHNIETSEAYFPNIVSTHNFQERIDTIMAVKRSGLQVCSGGIIGMGETWRDRIDMAVTLKELDVVSVPINILVPIKGSPLEKAPTLACADAIRVIAIFRIILPDKIIKIAAGRESVLKDFQAMAFMAGANGMLIGGYLTVKGRSIEEDRHLIEEVMRLWNG